MRGGNDETLVLCECLTNMQHYIQMRFTYV